LDVATAALDLVIDDVKLVKQSLGASTCFFIDDVPVALDLQG
jgi:hypothetical protein